MVCCTYIYIKLLNFKFFFAKYTKDAVCYRQKNNKKLKKKIRLFKPYVKRLSALKPLDLQISSKHVRIVTVDICVFHFHTTRLPSKYLKLDIYSLPFLKITLFNNFNSVIPVRCKCSHTRALLQSTISTFHIGLLIMRGIKLVKYKYEMRVDGLGNLYCKCVFASKRDSIFCNQIELDHRFY